MRRQAVFQERNRRVSRMQFGAAYQVRRDWRTQSRSTSPYRVFRRTRRFPAEERSGSLNTTTRYGIAYLQISMHDMQAMTVVDGCYNLTEVLLRQRFFDTLEHSAQQQKTTGYLKTTADSTRTFSCLIIKSCMSQSPNSRMRNSFVLVSMTSYKRTILAC